MKTFCLRKCAIRKLPKALVQEGCPFFNTSEAVEAMHAAWSSNQG